jgi:diaminopimelate decarboxylase
MSDIDFDYAFLDDIAQKVGTPFWLYDAEVLRARVAAICDLTSGEGLQARFAMKACPATKVLQEMRQAGVWIDAVSGNEALRALHAGFKAGNNPPQILFTSDVFRDNSLDVVLKNGLLPNAGSPGMLSQLARAGYKGPVALRINPGFGHGHVNACDTGGPSSKHGIWWEDLPKVAAEAERLGLELTMLHAHIGSGPQVAELLENLGRLAEVYAALLPKYPSVNAVSLGGGIPHNYRGREQADLAPLKKLLETARARLCDAAGRPIRVEMEPGRYFVAPSCTLVARVTDVKHTQTNEKGQGTTFAMVDAGFVDLVRPAMYGSYHSIELRSKEVLDIGEGTESDVVVAGPLCESGDVFTQGDDEMLAPRQLPTPREGDLLLLRDAGAYGYAMSSNYNSVGRAPQIWKEPSGELEQISRRETLEDLLKAETSQKI